MRIRASFVGVEGATKALWTALDEEIARAVEKAAVRISGHARVEHSFTNRTGMLESGIQAEESTGTLSRDTLSANVVANTRYASYVEERDPGWFPGPDGELIEAGKYSYLAAAWGEHWGEALAELDAGLERAIERAGWR